jgi:hypothetical protein
MSTFSCASTMNNGRILERTALAKRLCKLFWVTRAADRRTAYLVVEVLRQNQHACFQRVSTLGEHFQQPWRDKRRRLVVHPKQNSKTSKMTVPLSSYSER